MKIEIAKEDLWWLREILVGAIEHMEGVPCPDAFSKMPHVARKTYKKLSIAMRGWHYEERYFPKQKL